MMKIFITGISSGIGKELSKKLIASGHEVWGVARRIELLETLSKEINNRHFHFDKCDVTKFNEVKNIFKKMEMNDFLPDVVILNAAVDRDDVYPKISAKIGTETFRTNMEGALLWVSVFIEPFLKRNSGQFLAVSSLFAHWPDKSSVSYSASKAGLSMLFRGFRLRYAKTRIRFKTVYLGPVNTPINPRFKENSTDSISPIVVSASVAANFLVKCISKKRLDFYYPYYILVAFKLLGWLPDRLFEFLTVGFRR